jgi:hypothetical protein
MRLSMISIAALLVCTPAMAGTYTMNAAYNDALSSSVVVPGGENPWTTPITMTNASGTIAVYCDDFFHTFNVGGAYTMDATKVTTNYNGGVLTQQESNQIGRVADAGLADYRAGNEAGAIGAQVAIWNDEYHFNAFSTNSTVQSYVLSFEKITGSPTGDFAHGFSAVGGGQSQILGAPELSTWAMFGIGLLAMFGFGYKRRKNRLESFTGGVI